MKSSSDNISSSEDGISLTDESDDSVQVTKHLKRKCVPKRPLSRKRTPQDNSQALQALETWEAINRTYQIKLDTYIQTELQNKVESRVIHLEFDVNKLTPEDLLRSLYQQLFRSHKKTCLTDISETLSSIAELGDSGYTPKIVITISHWTTLLCQPTLFSYLEAMIQYRQSPFVFVLKGDLVQRCFAHQLRLKLDTNEDNIETILLLPSHPRGCKQLDQAWWGPIFEDVIWSEDVQVKSLTSGEKSPVLLKGSPQNLIPSHPGGYIFSQDLHHIRGLPKTTLTRTLVAPIRALQDLRTLAYS